MTKSITYAIVVFLQISTLVCWGQSGNNRIKLNASKPLSSQIAGKDKVYEVDGVMDLAGKTVKFPKGSQIQFAGGVIKNGTIETDCLLLNEWSFDNVKIKGNIDFTSPVSVPVEAPKEFINTILEHKPDNSDLPTVFIFSSNQVYNWDGVVIINKKNVTLTGGGTIEGRIHIGLDSEKFKKLQYDAYSSTSHSNIIISNLRFSKYHVIGTAVDSDKIIKYILNAEPTSDNIAISLINSCHVKIEGCFFDNVPYPVVYVPNDTYVNQNVRRLNIVNCDFEYCHTAVLAPSKINNSLEYGDLIFSNNNVLPTYRGLDVSCIDGLKVFNNTFNTCSKFQYGSNIYALYPGQVVITNNSFYGEYNGEAVVLDSPGTCLIDGNLFSSQGTTFPPTQKDRIACIRIKRTNNSSYTSGLSITNNLFTKIDRLPIYADGYFRGANIQGNIVSGTQYKTNKSVLYYFNSVYKDEVHIQAMRMADNILEDITGTLELRMDVITDYLNYNGLYPDRVWKKSNKTYTIRSGNDYIPICVTGCDKTRPIYVVSPLDSSYSGDVSFIFNGIQYTINVTSRITDSKLLNDIINVLKPDFGSTHLFKIIDNNLWIVGKTEDVPAITPMYENNSNTSPYRFQVIYQNLGYSIKIKDVDRKNFISAPLTDCGIDSGDDGKLVVLEDKMAVLKTTRTNRKMELSFGDRPVKKSSYKWLYNDMFFACGKGGTMATDKLLSEIVSLCYPDRASVNKKSLKLKETDKEYCFNSFGNAWESKYNTHVVDYVLITPTYVY